MDIAGFGSMRTNSARLGLRIASVTKASLAPTRPASSGVNLMASRLLKTSPGSAALVEPEPFVEGSLFMLFMAYLVGFGIFSPAPRRAFFRLRGETVHEPEGA